jgi:hypothetical protein
MLTEREMNQEKFSLPASEFSKSNSLFFYDPKKALLTLLAKRPLSVQAV